MGRKFFYFQVKLPVYLIGESIRLTKLKGKVTNDILDFIETDITGFAVSVCCKEKFEYKDVEPKLIFEAVDGAKKHFVFKPPFQVNASGFKCEHFKEWGLELVQGEPTESPPCAEASHGNHVYLMPFFFDNDEMLTILEKGLSGANEDESALLEEYQLKLTEIRDSDAAHRHTVYHCAGLPFSKRLTYNELDWTERLYHCLVDHLPVDVKLYDSFNHKQRFKALQEMFSTMKSSSIYFFCAVPDLIFKKTSSAHTSTAAGSAVHVESIDCIEIKQGRLSTGRTADFPHEYTQIFAQLHFLATAFVVKALKKRQCPSEVSCNGLLLSKSSEMVLFTLKIRMGEIGSCELKFESSKVLPPSLPYRSFRGSDVCAAITKLVS